MLDLADELGLDDAQLHGMQDLFDGMQGQAVPAGEAAPPKSYMVHIPCIGMNTTVLVSGATRDILAKARDTYGVPSLDAAILRALRDATPTAKQLWRRHASRALAVCERHGVRRLIAFGSRVRDDRHPASDLDLVVEMPTSGGVQGLFALRDDLSQVLGVRVDLGDMPTKDSRLWTTIRKEGVALVGPAP